MKAIVYKRPNGGLSIVRPVEGMRLAHSLTLADGTVLAGKTPLPVCHILRKWPVAGARAQWAETEDEFVARVRSTDVPKDATDVRFIGEALIPSRKKRATLTFESFIRRDAV